MRKHGMVHCVESVPSGEELIVRYAVMLFCMCILHLHLEDACFRSLASVGIASVMILKLLMGSREDGSVAMW